MTRRVPISALLMGLLLLLASCVESYVQLVPASKRIIPIKTEVWMNSITPGDQGLLGQYKISAMTDGQVMVAERGGDREARLASFFDIGASGRNLYGIEIKEGSIYRYGLVWVDSGGLGVNGLDCSQLRNGVGSAHCAPKDFEHVRSTLAEVAKSFSVANDSQTMDYYYLYAPAKPSATAGISVRAYDASKDIPVIDSFYGNDEYGAYDYSDEFDPTKYLTVIAVTPGGPAAQAGMLPGDVIEYYSTSKEDRSVNDIVEVMSRANPGIVMTFGILRGQKIEFRNIFVRLEERR